MASRGGGGVDGGLDELLRVLQRATDTPVAGGSNACRGVREGIEITQGMPCVLRGMTQVSDGRERRGPWSDDARDQAPSAYLRPSYPLAGCSPAEPTSVSPGEKSIPQACRRCKINQELPVRKPGKSVAKEWPFFVQRMGSTSDITSKDFLVEPISKVKGKLADLEEALNHVIGQRIAAGVD